MELDSLRDQVEERFPLVLLVNDEEVLRVLVNALELQ
jgi:hypothetical protein